MNHDERSFIVEFIHQGALQMKTILAAATAILLVGTGSSYATVLRDTIGGDAYGASSGWGVQNVGSAPDTQSIGLGFLTATSTQVNGIEAFIGPQPGSLLTTFTLGIMADNGSGIPTGTFLYQTSLDADSAHPVLLNNLNWSIDAGSYFLVAIADFATLNSWQFNTQQIGSFAFTAGDPNGNWLPANNNNYLPEATISTENISAVPLGNPTLPSVVLGGLMMGWIAVRRRAQKTQSLARSA
ncbi:hypothetical protein JJE66_29335 [Bradyrhizobium diazoefficiens]|uniref:hypothetical protein n=1 Tax=Bradyrhizobium diazoefficiens TaxID=1355477 RepID=UPI00190B650F|nr:hypothetical protein [Bradyrhizobium diazoefficiens]MBK3665322.1 hypothetical protein [Bradyrhizobium diazoefficiens]